MRRLIGVLVAVGLSLAAGCGYTTRAFVSQTGYRTIHIRAFANRVDTTSEESVGSRFQTDYALLENTDSYEGVDGCDLDGELRVVSEDEADIVLSGDLVHYRRESLRDASDDTPQEYRIAVFVNIKLTDIKTGKVLWEKTNFAGDTSYYTTGSYVKSESQALEDALADLARRIVETTLEIW